jgi:hypothetical protein
MGATPPEYLWNDEAEGRAIPLASGAAARYLQGMKRVFDMDDRARLPWRFFGAQCSVLARL